MVQSFIVNNCGGDFVKNGSMQGKGKNQSFK